MEPRIFRIVVEGEFEPSYGSEFDGMEVESNGNGTVAIVGRVEDQAQLHRLLNTVGRLELTLVSLEPVSRRGTPTPG